MLWYGAVCCAVLWCGAVRCAGEGACLRASGAVAAVSPLPPQVGAFQYLGCRPRRESFLQVRHLLLSLSLAISLFLSLSLSFSLSVSLSPSLYLSLGFPLSLSLSLFLTFSFLLSRTQIILYHTRSHLCIHLLSIRHCCLIYISLAILSIYSILLPISLSTHRHLWTIGLACGSMGRSSLCTSDRLSLVPL